MRSQDGTRIGLAISVVAALALVAGPMAGRSTAAPGAQQGLTGVKFNVRYEGSFDATWRTSTPVVVPDPNNRYRCRGGDQSGTLTSSVRSNTKPFVFILGKTPGGRSIHHDFRPRQGGERAMVSSNRTAQGFSMQFSGGQCLRYDIPQPGCSAHTFPGEVAPISSTTGSLPSGINPVYQVFLAWQLEPELPMGCDDGIRYPDDFNYGWQAVALRIKPLYRCGMRKPRRCKLTIGRERTYAHNVTQGDTTYSSTVHLRWSLTFTAAGKT